MNHNVSIVIIGGGALGPWVLLLLLSAARSVERVQVSPQLGSARDERDPVLPSQDDLSQVVALRLRQRA